MKKFLENLKSEWPIVSSQAFGCLLTLGLYLNDMQFKFLGFSIVFGLLLISTLTAIWIDSRK